MPIKVRVRDFQSLGDVSLEINGLTVVTGANNIGKSALMRAIRGAFQNTKGTSFVRRGQSKATVEITFDDGKSILWEKGKGKGDKPTYTVNNGNPIHPGSAVPDEVRALGVRPIQAGGREIWPQIARQFDGQMFLLDQPGSVLAEAVADVDRVSHLNDALRLAASDLRSASSELATRRLDLSNLEDEMKQFSGIDDVVTELREIEAKSSLIARVETAIQSLIVLRDRHHIAVSTVDSLSAIQTVDVPDARMIDEIRAMASKLEVLAEIRERLKKARNRAQSLSLIEAVVIPESVEIIDSIRKERDGLIDLGKRYQKAKDQVSRLEKADLAVNLETASLEKLAGVLSDVIGIRDHHKEAQRRVVEAEEALRMAQDDVVQATDELTGILGGFDQCPVCNSTLPHEKGAHE